MTQTGRSSPNSFAAQKRVQLRHWRIAAPLAVAPVGIDGGEGGGHNKGSGRQCHGGGWPENGNNFAGRVPEISDILAVRSVTSS